MTKRQLLNKLKKQNIILTEEEKNAIEFNDSNDFDVCITKQDERTGKEVVDTEKQTALDGKIQTVCNWPTIGTRGEWTMYRKNYKANDLDFCDVGNPIHY